MSDDSNKDEKPDKPPKRERTRVTVRGIDPELWANLTNSLATIRMPDLSSLTLLTNYKVPDFHVPALDSGFLTTVRTFEDERAELRKRFDAQTRALLEEKTSAQVKEGRIKELESTLEELRAKERIGFLLSRVSQVAQRQLLASEDFRRRFLDTPECRAFVMSVDIRRSTELMLKARSPEAFASFITTLCADLMSIVTTNFGVFDKFTGDGVLAFFPEFFTGDDAPYYAIAAADQCHASFTDHYQRFRRSFSSVLTGIGLGIGIDYGSVHLVQMAGGLTVVGGPVVYACRLSGAQPGTTLVNQPAYEVISEKVGGKCFIDETTIEIKHEGGMLAYDVRLNGRSYEPRPPAWCDSDSRSSSVGEPGGEAPSGK